MSAGALTALVVMFALLFSAMAKLGHSTDYEQHTAINCLFIALIICFVFMIIAIWWPALLIGG